MSSETDSHREKHLENPECFSTLCTHRGPEYHSHSGARHLLGATAKLWLRSHASEVDVLETAMMGFDVVLILDDNERRRASMSYLLRKLGLHGEILSSLSEFFIPEGRAVALLAADDSPAFPIEDVFQRLTSLGVWWPTICFSEKTEAASIVRALRDGALNYLIWPFEQETLSSALEHLAVEGALRAKAFNRQADARRRLTSLSPREQEVASKVAEGKSSKEIGQDLGISSRTIEIHRATAIKKIGGTRATDLMRLWFDAVREA